MKPTFIARQGDVLIVEVRSIPKDAKDITPEGPLVLAFGEVTTHSHAIYETKKARLLDVQAERYLQVVSEATLRHEEHGAIVLREGRYQQAFQTEEFGEEVRAVAD